MAVAARGRDVEARGNIPAEIAVEGVVIGGFGEHGRLYIHVVPAVPAIHVSLRSMTWISQGRV